MMHQTNCKFCGQGGLFWGPSARLVDAKGTLHVCDGYFKARGVARPAVPAFHKPELAAHELNPDKIKTLADIEQFTHWKSGDGMKLNSGPFDISEIVVLQEPTDKTACRILYFDEDKKCRGWQKMKLESPNA